MEEHRARGLQSARAAEQGAPVPCSTAAGADPSELAGASGGAGGRPRRCTRRWRGNSSAGALRSARGSTFSGLPGWTSSCCSGRCRSGGCRFGPVDGSGASSGAAAWRSPRWCGCSSRAVSLACSSACVGPSAAAVGLPPGCSTASAAACSWRRSCRTTARRSSASSHRSGCRSSGSWRSVTPANATRPTAACRRCCGCSRR